MILNLLNKLFGEFLGSLIKSKTFKSLYNSNLSKIIRNDFEKKPSIYIIGLVVILLIIGLNISNQNQLNRRNEENQRIYNQQQMNSNQQKNEQIRLYKERTEELQRECFCGWSKPGGADGRTPSKSLGYKRSCC